MRVPASFERLSRHPEGARALGEALHPCGATAGAAARRAGRAAPGAAESEHGRGRTSRCVGFIHVRV